MLQPMMAPRRRPSYSLGWETPRDLKTHSHWLVIPSTTPHDTPVPSPNITPIPKASPLFFHLQLRPRHSIHTHVTRIGLIDLDDQTKELASTKHVEDDINQILTERRILFICGICPQSYPPPDTLMETRILVKWHTPKPRKAGCM